MAVWGTLARGPLVLNIDFVLLAAFGRSGLVTHAVVMSVLMMIRITIGEMILVGELLVLCVE